MLELNNIHARYGAITALRGISISVSQGELVALLGANGAGKSTTLASIAGVLRPWQGDILFEGNSILGKSPEQIARLGISLVPEGRDIFPSLTVEENLRLGAFTRSEKTEYNRNLAEIFQLFPVLKERLHQPGGTLSGGEQQMVAMGRALMARPKLLLMDEPSMGLAPILVERIFETVVEINQQGTPILLVEQNALMALDVANRGYVLETGRVALADDAKALRENEQVRKTYLGED